MKLYDFPLSGNCHKVRLMLSFLKLEAEIWPVDLGNGQQRTPEFLALNPLAQVPVLQDGETVLRDSHAILLYLAKAYDKSGRWLPNHAISLGQIGAWLSLSANELANGPATLRLIELFKAPRDATRAAEVAGKACQLIEATLHGQPWLLDHEHPTVADVACYPYLALASDGKWSLEAYPNLRAWLARFEALPGFQPLLDYAKR